MKKNLSQEELDKIEFIKSCDINYCKCYPEGEIHPELKVFICSKCELPIPGVDEDIIRSLVHITGVFEFLK